VASDIQPGPDEITDEEAKREYEEFLELHYDEAFDFLIDRCFF